MNKNHELIIKHYNEEVSKFGLSQRSTMDDDIVRDKELEMILNTLKYVLNKNKNKKINVLDLGCGNGYTLGFLTKNIKKVNYFGLDYTPEMIKLCNERKLKSCKFIQGDARKLNYNNNFFDFIFTERCLINILDKNEQIKALDEIYRILKPKGYYLMIECFNDGLENNNRARKECGLETLEARYHNLYFDKDVLYQYLEKKFKIFPSIIKMSKDYTFNQNFLSSHYFVARIFHPLITKGEHIKNTEFVKFFNWLPPIGNFSQIQGLILQKK